MRMLEWSALSVVVALFAGCSLKWGDTGNDGGAGADGPKSNSGQQPGAWALPGAEGSWSSDGAGGGSDSPTGAGGSGSLGSPGKCSFGSPTTVHLSVPGWRTLASPPLARALTNAKLLPDPARVRASDFLNYYQVKYPAPADGDAIGFHAGVHPGELANELVLQIAVQSPAKYARPPVALAVVVDTSLSMAGEPWSRAKAAVAALANAMIPGDTFTLVTAKRDQQTAEDATAAAALAGGLALDAGEDLAGALDDAYQAVSSKSKPGALGRVVLISDGAAQPTSINLGVVAEHLQLGVPLIGVGVGDAPSYEGGFLDAATSVGGGANLYVDSVTEAAALLRDRFDELMITIASDVDVVVTLPDAVRFQTLDLPVMADSPTGIATANLAAGRTLVIRNTLETCYETYDPVLSLPVGIVVRYRPAGSPKLVDSPDVGGLLGDLKHKTDPQIFKAGAIAAYAAALADARKPLLDRAMTLIQSARNSDDTLVKDPALFEIEGLIQGNLALIEAAGN